MRRLVGVGCWALLLALGVWTIENRERHKSAAATGSVGVCLGPAQKKSMPHLIARTDMGVNWRIRMTDVSRPSAEGTLLPGHVVGKYIRCKVSTNEAVILSEVGMTPRVSVTTGKTLYLLPLRGNEVEVLNAGQHLDLFQGGTPSIANAEVLAVLCGPDCDLLLQLTATEVELLRLGDPMKVKKVLRQG